ncbi:UbiA family prenyltransferase [Streptomyces canus]|uniref:UbiA family prenyltransferase n=1 Tax=Streptomyces canus TaxID=58343 RepID=UPI003720CC5D
MIRSRPAGLAPPAAVRTQKSARPGDDQNPAGFRAGRGRRARLRDRAELLCVSALFTVPGDALAGAAATGLRPDRGMAYAVGASLCLHEAGMALEDWADRDEDAVERPHRPLPSGRISPAAAPGAAGLPTAAGRTFAARAGRPAVAVAPAPTATIWAYHLRLKHTPAAPAATAPPRKSTAWDAVRRSCPSTRHLFAAATAASPRATTTVRSSWSPPPRAVSGR